MAQKYRFRNVMGVSHTKWEDILPFGGTSDGFIVAGNSKFIAFPLQGGMGSTLGVLSYSQSGRVKHVPQIRAHTSHITDFKFLPYEENRVITCSQDTTIKIWHLDDENVQEKDTLLTTLQGHSLKVNLVAPHHSAKGIIASCSYDKTIKVWDSIQGKDLLTVNQGSQHAVSLEWSHDGALLGTTWNDKIVRLIDPREQTFFNQFTAHQSSRAQKFAWLGNTSKFVTSGFDNMQKRQLFMWDIRNTATHIPVNGCSQAQGILHVHYDPDLGILYTNGKGESLLRFYEYTNGSLVTHQNDLLSKDAAKGYGFLPKYAVDTKTSEIMRVIKLCGKSAETISLIYPRKTTTFQEDLYPNCAFQYGNDAISWISGHNADPQLACMNDLTLLPPINQPESVIKNELHVQQLQKHVLDITEVKQADQSEVKPLVESVNTMQNVVESSNKIENESTDQLKQVNLKEHQVEATQQHKIEPIEEHAKVADQQYLVGDSTVVQHHGGENVIESKQEVEKINEKNVEQIQEVEKMSEKTVEQIQEVEKMSEKTVEQIQEVEKMSETNVEQIQEVEIMSEKTVEQIQEVEIMSEKTVEQIQEVEKMSENTFEQIQEVEKISEMSVQQNVLQQKVQLEEELEENNFIIEQSKSEIKTKEQAQNDLERQQQTVHEKQSDIQRLNNEQREMDQEKLRHQEKYILTLENERQNLVNQKNILHSNFSEFTVLVNALRNKVESEQIDKDEIVLSSRALLEGWERILGHLV